MWEYKEASDIVGLFSLTVRVLLFVCMEVRLNRIGSECKKPKSLQLK